jgi:hypothetical protein
LAILIWLFAVTSVFQGMVIPGLESAGISPSLLVQTGLAAYALVYWCLHGFSVPRQWSAVVFWFTSFVAVCVISGLLFPILFKGIQVYGPRDGIDEQYSTKAMLQLSPSNFAQLLFIGLNWLYLLLMTTIDRIDFRATMARAYLASGLIVVFFSYYQLISIFTGIYYPSAILLNNLSYGIADASIGFSLLPRIQSTFTEASTFAMFMSGFVAWCYVKFLYVSGAARARWGALLLASVISLLLSASTTGYLALGLFLVAHTLLSLFQPGAARNRQIALRILAGFALVLGAAYLLIPEAALILDHVLFDKGDSSSSLHRLASDRFALDVLARTHYLGAGLGSNRPSSFITFLLSNVGIAGTLCLAIAAALLFSMGRQARQAAASAARIDLQAAGWALFTMVASKAIAGPDLNYPPMWVLVGYYLLFIRTDAPALPLHPRQLETNDIR